MPIKDRVRRFLPPRGSRIETTEFGVFVRDDGRALPLWTGYRDLMKSRWRLYWWPSRLLFELNLRVSLPRELQVIRDLILRARAMPLSITELAQEVVPFALAQNRHVVVDELDPDLQVPRIAVVPTPAQVAAWRDSYRGLAASVLDELVRRGVGISGSRVLEIGAGTGFATLAIASMADVETVGVEMDPNPLERLGVADAVFAALGSPARAQLVTADAANLPYDAETFDAAFSYSAIEHMRDLPSVLAELRRVLRPGGIMLHAVDPWFSPRGGHAMCTLDAPWGHVRLTRGEVGRYFRELRPHEAETALSFYDTGFQQPRRTQQALRRLVEEAGFEMLEWQPEIDRERDHAPFLTPGLLAECAEQSAEVTHEDLMASSVRLVARAR